MCKQAGAIEELFATHQAFITKNKVLEQRTIFVPVPGMHCKSFLGFKAL